MSTVILLNNSFYTALRTNRELLVGKLPVWGACYFKLLLTLILPQNNTVSKPCVENA